MRTACRGQFIQTYQVGHITHDIKLRVTTPQVHYFIFDRVVLKNVERVGNFDDLLLVIETIEEDARQFLSFKAAICSQSLIILHCSECDDNIVSSSFIVKLTKHGWIRHRILLFYLLFVQGFHCKRKYRVRLDSVLLEWV